MARGIDSTQSCERSSTGPSAVPTSELDFAQFAVLRLLITSRSDEVIAVWRSMTWPQQRQVAQKFGLQDAPPEVHLIRFFPEMAAYLLGMRTETQ